MAKFVIKKSKNGQFYFVLIANNGEIIATSEMYTTKQSAREGINAVVLASGEAETVDKT